MIKHARASKSWNDKTVGQKGFTLIELLVVVIILGILAAVVVLAVNGVQKNSKEKACGTERKTIEAAAASYYSANDDTWPSSQTQLLTPPAGQQPYIKSPNYTWSISTTNGDATLSPSPQKGVADADCG